MPTYLEQTKQLLERSSFQINANTYANPYQANTAGASSFTASASRSASNTQFAFAAQLATRATNEFAPSVVGIDRSVEIGDEIGVRTLFKASDLDGNSIERFRFYDSGGTSSSGALILDGRVQTARRWFEVGLAGLNKLRYKSGLAPGSEAINIRVYDGLFWSNLGKSQVSTVKPNTGKPIVTTTDGEVVAFENIQISSLFSAIDPEGKPIVKYAIRDTATRDAGGHLSVNGKKKKEGVFFPVKPQWLNSLRYFGRRTIKSNSEKIEVRAFDGKLWSDIATLTIKTVGNAQIPLVVANTIELGLSETIDASQLFTDSDADGNTIKKYRFKDTGLLKDGGFLTFDGAIKKANRAFVIDATKLELLQYTSASTADFERIEIEAFDGKYWSKLKSASVTTIELPEVVVLDPVQVVDEVVKVRVKDIIAQGDSGPAPVYYEVFDANAGSTSAYFEFGSRDLPANLIHRISASKIGNLKLQAAKSDTGRDFDEFYIRANNGQYTGAWSRFQVSTETIGPRAVASDASWFGSAPPSQVITYSFALRTPLYYEFQGTDEWARRGTFSTLNPDVRAGVRYALDTWAAVTGLTFEEVTDTTIDGGLTGGMMRFGSYDLTNAATLAYAYYPDRAGLTGDNLFGDVWFNTDFFPFVYTGAAGTYDMTLGDEGILTAIHEIGHAIGLSHSFNEQDGEVYLHPFQENHKFSVMSYNRNTDVPANEADPITPLIYDIMRAQQVYGAEKKINHTDTVWKYDANDNFVKALWDPDGHDLLDFSNYTQNGSYDLREGTFSSVGGRADNFFVSYGTVIEDITGGRGNETITGNEVDNVIIGGVGRDTLTGGGGTDMLMAGEGNDTYIYRQSDGKDTINEQKLAGRDRLEIWGFDGINKLDKDLTFRKLGKDLRIELTINGTPTQGTIIIKNQGLGASRIETLSLNRNNGSQIGVDIDLTSIYTKATNVPTQFKLTNFTSTFGNLATPV